MLLRRPAFVRPDQPALRPREPLMTFGMNSSGGGAGPFGSSRCLPVQLHPRPRLGTGDLCRELAAAGHRAGGVRLLSRDAARGEDRRAARGGGHPAAAGPRRERRGATCGFALRNVVSLRVCSRSSPGWCSRSAGPHCSRRPNPEPWLMRTRPSDVLPQVVPRSAGCSRTERLTRTSLDRRRICLHETRCCRCSGRRVPRCSAADAERRHDPAPRGDPGMSARAAPVGVAAEPLGEAFDLLAGYLPPMGVFFEQEGEGSPVDRRPDGHFRRGYPVRTHGRRPDTSERLWSGRRCHAGGDRAR